MCTRKERGNNFNSIKVQLKQNQKFELRIAVGFQFHKGTIKTRAHRVGVGCRADFNSIKVQLKRKLLAKPLNELSFQFHKGTIKTLCLSMKHLTT